MKYKLIYLLVYLLLFSACEPADLAEHYEQLPSGKSVRIIEVGKVYSTVDEKYFLMIRYETKINIDDIQNLRNEAQDVWKVFQPMVNAVSLSFAAIQANTPPEGGQFVTTSDTYTHVLEKMEDGRWFIVPSNQSE